jgi:phage terminase Nu1 subunit (DNA packaging protein)
MFGLGAAPRPFQQGVSKAVNIDENSHHEIADSQIRAAKTDERSGIPYWQQRGGDAYVYHRL